MRNYLMSPQLISPIDPIAGNPISLMSQMVYDDFELAFVDAIHDSDEVDENGKKVGSEMGAGVQYSQYNVSGITSRVVALSPFTYRKNIANSGVKLLLKIPALKMISTDNAKTYQASSAKGLIIHLNCLNLCSQLAIIFLRLHFTSRAPRKKIGKN